MTGVTVFFKNGTSCAISVGKQDAQNVLRGFQRTEPDGTVRIIADNAEVLVNKRHVTHVVVGSLE